MKTTTWILVAAFLAAGLAMPATSEPPGHYSLTWDRTITRFDFKNGVGIADPADENNECTALLLGVWQDFNPALTYWVPDLRIGTNLNGPIIGISNLSPPLTPVPASSWLAPGSAGIPLIPCPLSPGFPTGNSIWLIWSGMNWHTVEDSMDSEINLCSQQSQTNGCFPVVGSQILWASACPWATATFTADYADAKGKEINGLPWDTLHMKSDKISCTPTHSHNHTADVTDFDVNFAAQGFDLIKNEAVVHAGTGTSYVVVCWKIDYIDLDNLAAGRQTALTHDWKLILDLADDPANIANAVLNHVGPLNTNGLPPPIGTSTGTFAFRGLYSLSETAAGQNGRGPCTEGGLPETKKPKPADRSGGKPLSCTAERTVANGNDVVHTQCTPGTGAECTVVPGGAGPIVVGIPAAPWDVSVICTMGQCVVDGRLIANANYVVGPVSAGDFVQTRVRCGASDVRASAQDFTPGPASKSDIGSKPNAGTYNCLIDFAWSGVGAAYNGVGSCQK